MITEQEQQKIMKMVLLNPFDRLMNYEVVTMEPGHLVMKTIAQREIVENSYQSTHGGFLLGRYLYGSSLFCARQISHDHGTSYFVYSPCRFGFDSDRNGRGYS